MIPVADRLSKVELGMALSACCSFCLVAGEWLWLAGTLTMAILGSPWIPWRYQNPAVSQRRLFSLVGAPFVLLAVSRMLSSRSTVDTSLGLAVLGTVYVLTCGVIELYRRAPEGRPELFHVSILTVMLVAGISWQNRTYPLFLALYAAFTVAFLRRPYPGRGVEASSAPLPGIVLAGLLTAGILAGEVSAAPGFIRRLGQAISGGMVGNVLPESRLFGVTSNLDSLYYARRSRALEARVYGPATRLRVQILTTYAHGQWTLEQRREERASLRAQEGWTVLPGPAPAQKSLWTISPVKPVVGVLPLPAGAYRVQGLEEEVELDPNDALHGDSLDPYTVEASGRLDDRCPHRYRPGQPRWADYLALPPELKPELLAYAERFGVPLGEPAAQCQALESYLAEHGSYDTTAFHSQGEPVLTFLKEDLAGHCELFASAMALILRARGIPTRYVLGYQLAERNPWGGYYLVRECDAHAWLEAWIPDRGWETFDPTPAAQARTDLVPPWSEGLWDEVRAQSWSLLVWVRRLRLMGPLLVVGLLAALGWLVRRHPHLLRRLWSRPVPPDPAARLLSAVLRDMARLGLERRPEETLLEFGQRVAGLLGEPRGSALRAWLELYCRVRFGAASTGEREALESLP